MNFNVQRSSRPFLIDVGYVGKIAPLREGAAGTEQWTGASEAYAHSRNHPDGSEAAPSDQTAYPLHRTLPGPWPSRNKGI